VGGGRGRVCARPRDGPSDAHVASIGVLGPHVRLGLLLSGQHPAGDSAMGAVGQHLEQVELARELGFSSVWASQHFLSHPFLYLQSVPLLARVAAAAEGMTVGTAILLLTLLNPVEVAENAATLDAIAAGRFVLGVGIGYRPVENAAFGVAHRRADLFERKLEIVRRLLAGDRVTATGHGFELEHARLTLVPERPPPIWVAANSDAAVRRAARLGDAWLVNPHARLDELERQMGLYRAARAEYGLPAATSTPVLKEVCVAATDEQALELARPRPSSPTTSTDSEPTTSSAGCNGQACPNTRS
jgi:alkanesulfonate monooxygenase SsuD/methylene tetrahydromethanopterin reductase-like flavin-dependent oxidoreductase (luciferase family)